MNKNIYLCPIVNVAGSEPISQEVVAGDVFVFPLMLRSGTNRIAIRYAGGEAHLNGDLRLIAVAYGYIELRSTQTTSP
ncbi:MAG: hypothetical protein HC822_05130 [Oscillochloris sp.]|nr:hypothetical protein [Oscillochloris sp.]